MNQRKLTVKTTSRELVLQAVAHEAPARIPATLYIDADLKSRFLRERGFDAEKEFLNDTVRVLWEVESKRMDDEFFTDPFGCTWRDHKGGYMFINPLMAQYWTFDARRVVANMTYSAELAQTESMEEARRVIEQRREGLELRPRRQLPL